MKIKTLNEGINNTANKKGGAAWMDKLEEDGNGLQL